MYSCLAGYVEQCESLEEAIAREVKEEADIEVSRSSCHVIADKAPTVWHMCSMQLGALLYHSSQPWPVGRGASCQLMIGFIAEAISTDVNIDQEELEASLYMWYTW